MDDLVAVEANVDVYVTLGDDDAIVYSLALSCIKRTDGDLRPGRYRATILLLRELEPQENIDVFDSQ